LIIQPRISTGHHCDCNAKTAGHRRVEVDSGGETRKAASTDLWAAGHVRPAA